MFARSLVLIGLALVITACGETSPEAERLNGAGAEQAAPTLSLIHISEPPRPY